MRITSALAVLALWNSVHANLVITEIMSASRHSNTLANGDWWELTNNGATSVNIAGYSWNDETNVSRQYVFLSRVIGPGASIIILDEPSAASVPTFRALWGIPSSVVVLTEENFAGFPAFSGSEGDSLYLYGTSGAVVDSWTFPPASDGQSFARFSDGTEVPGGLSTVGVYGAVTSTDSTPDIGSPGVAPPPPAPVSPVFLVPFATSWVVGRPLADSPFRVVAADPNAGDRVTLTVLSKPAWLTVTDLGDGTARLSGTPTSAVIGSHSFEMKAQDDSGLTAVVFQTYALNILPAASPVLLNEYNAVAPANFLDGGDANTPGGRSDAFFGRIAGNGGAWLELVVTGDGTGGSTVDLRGWSVEIASATASRTLKLSGHGAWAAVPAGTILTFTALNTSQGGLDTQLNRSSGLSIDGTLWSNVWMYDPILVDQAASTHPATPAIGSDGTVVTLRNAAGVVTFGPAGETIAAEDTDMNGIPDSLIGVSDVEMLKLEQNPVPGIDPIFGSYRDGTSSTFGKPNDWGGGVSTQSFLPYLQGNTPPVFSSLPPTHAARGGYEVVLTASDVNGQTPAISAPALPSFLTLTDHGDGTATLATNRPLTPADMGNHEVTVLADDGQPSLNTTYLPFTLRVLYPAPTVILNEYNAVSPINYLNGGALGYDSDGIPVAVDSHFGRVAGNGGDWFELVVTGGGGPGTVDLRGWTIAVGKADTSETFTASHVITLTSHSYWAAVPAGTVLTFITRPGASGGLDTGLNRVDQLGTSGYAWSNIYLGDSALVSGSGLTSIDIDQDGTQLLISDAGGVPVFGPAGEGVSPKSGIGSTEILELEAHPTPSVSPYDVSSATEEGYDDGSSGSTFGSPNSFLDADGVTEISQDFSRYIPTPYLVWAASFALADPSEGTDSDRDGSSNLEEYLFGGDPSDPGSSPGPLATASGFSIDLRVDDPAYAPLPQWSADLRSWSGTGFTVGGDAPSALGSSYVRRSYTHSGLPADGLFFRMSLDPPSPYFVWAASFALVDPSPGTDSDGDGSSNLEEYLFGGDPSDPGSSPRPLVTGSGFSIDVRVDDPAYAPLPQWSADLQSWSGTGFTVAGDAPSAFGDSYTRRAYTWSGSPAARRFFRMFQP